MDQRQRQAMEVQVYHQRKDSKTELCATQFNVSVSTYNLQSRKPKKQSMSRMKLS